MELADILTVKAKQRNYNQGMKYIYFMLCLAFRALFVKSCLIDLSERNYFSGLGSLGETSLFSRFRQNNLEEIFVCDSLPLIMIISLSMPYGTPLNV